MRFGDVVVDGCELLDAQCFDMRINSQLPRHSEPVGWNDVSRSSNAALGELAEHCLAGCSAALGYLCCRSH